MAEKLWQGADLIFDLDGDHLPGVTDRDFPGMLDVIHDQAWSLWNDFLEPEFGFKEDHLQVTFSGHRGFHLHYRDPSLFHLDSEARRELVSHIRGEGVDVQGGLARYH
ncbi:MAG: DNA primase small subunit domain-containing protein, partial [Poseidonia sp.]